MGGEGLGGELDRQIAVDSKRQGAFSSSHREWALLSGIWFA
jgi:hypothetical protein